ncbi:MAG: hypothetical protein R3A11_07270 [Bdellovibrionota bacterium]
MKTSKPFFAKPILFLVIFLVFSCQEDQAQFYDVFINPFAWNQAFEEVQLPILTSESQMKTSGTQGQLVKDIRFVDFKTVGVHHRKYLYLELEGEFVFQLDLTSSDQEQTLSFQCELDPHTMLELEEISIKDIEKGSQEFSRNVHWQQSSKRMQDRVWILRKSIPCSCNDPRWENVFQINYQVVLPKDPQDLQKAYEFFTSANELTEQIRQRSHFQEDFQIVLVRSSAVHVDIFQLVRSGGKWALEIDQDQASSGM